MTGQHIPRTAANYSQYDTHGNYMDGVIIAPVHVMGANVRTSDGRWANCHPPNRTNLRGAYGIRWWVTGEEAERFEAIYQDDLAFSGSGFFHREADGGVSNMTTANDQLPVKIMGCNVRYSDGTWHTMGLPYEQRTIIEEALDKPLIEMLDFLPKIEGCDDWTLTTTQRRGRKFWTFELPCTERREAGHSNHARAEVFWTDCRVRVNWSHGQGHNYKRSAGSSQQYRLTDGPVSRLSLVRVLAHIQKYAQHDAHIFVIQ